LPINWLFPGINQWRCREGEGVCYGRREKMFFKIQTRRRMYGIYCEFDDNYYSMEISIMPKKLWRLSKRIIVTDHLSIETDPKSKAVELIQKYEKAEDYEDELESKTFQIDGDQIQEVKEKRKVKVHHWDGGVEEILI
jgi:hypothetical protein